MNRLADDFERFSDQVVHLINCHYSFTELFESGADVTETLEETAQLFFEDVNVVFLEAIFLAAARLLDPADAGKNLNISVEYIADEIKNLGLSTPEIRRKKKLLYRAKKPIFAARSKIIAHTDRATSRADKTLGEHTVECQTAFLENLKSFNNLASIALGQGQQEYTPNAAGDVRDLIKVLKRGLKVYGR